LSRLSINELSEGYRYSAQSMDFSSDYLYLMIYADTVIAKSVGKKDN
jgi:hypothetical protein